MFHFWLNTYFVQHATMCTCASDSHKATCLASTEYGRVRKREYGSNETRREVLELTLRKSDLDRANKDKQHKVFPSHFTVTLVFERSVPSISRPESETSTATATGTEQHTLPTRFRGLRLSNGRVIDGGALTPDDIDDLSRDRISDTDEQDEWSSFEPASSPTRFS